MACTIDEQPAAVGDSVDLLYMGPAPSVVRVGTVLSMLIQRDGAFALRVKDSLCPVLANFSGMTYFPYSPSWVVTATFVPHPTPVKAMVPNILSEVGTEARRTSHCNLTFTAPNGSPVEIVTVRIAI